MGKGYAKELLEYMQWVIERYEFAVNYIDSVNKNSLTGEGDFFVYAGGVIK